MFKVGDIVVYSATGVCEVSEICEKEFCKVMMKYYVLTPLLQKSATVFVPTENSKLTQKMHNILTKEEFDSAFAAAAKRTPVRPETEAERRARFGEILDSGDRCALLLMVYDLRKLQKEQTENSRRLHIADERLMNSAENLLFEEVAYVYGIEKENAADFIKSKF